MMNTRCRIELFGGLRVRQGDRTLTRFRTQKTASLLAYLAFHHDRKHPREVLAELIWPEHTPRSGRDSLNTALSSLRRQLEPPGVPAGTVLMTNRFSVQLNPAAVITDVAEFEAALQSEKQTTRQPEQTRHLLTAVELYRGELLPGFYDEWIELERTRLEEAYLNALDQLVKHLTQARDFNRALDYARRAVKADPLREESHVALMRLLADSGQPAAALEQFRELERLLREKLNAAPSASTRALAREAREQLAMNREQLALVGGGQSVVSRQQAESRKQKAKGKKQKAEKDSREGWEDGRVGERRLTLLHPHTPLSPHSHPPTGNLPLQFTRFFGREKEIEHLQKMLRTPSTRLVTLTGAGGSGKTRLAIEVGERLRDGFSGGVWFVPLVDIADPRLIPDAVRDALRLPRSPGVEPLEQVIDALSQQPALLILDNVEHLLGSGFWVLGSGEPDSPTTQNPEPKTQNLVLTLLERVPTLTLFVTSRQRLNVGGEREFPVSPLPIPSVECRVSSDEATPFPVTRHPLPVTPESLMQVPSVQLFVDRAQAGVPDFQVTKRNAPTIAALCERLEGIPLAIELVAAWAGTLTVGQMLSRLSRRFDLLVSRRKDLPERHRTLWATVEWSYRLLPAELRPFFTRLSIFRGGWTLEAADAVCCDEGLGIRDEDDRKDSSLISHPSSLDALRQLRERSLINAEDVSGAMRYRMLETLREFGAEQVTPNEQSTLSQRHARYFLSLAEDAEAHLMGAEQVAWLDRLEREHDNFRAALEWSLNNAMEVCLRLGGALWRFWYMRSHLSEGREWLRKALERTGKDEGLEMRDETISHPSSLISHPLTFALAKALEAAGILAFYQNDCAAARPLLTDSLALWRQLDDARGIAQSLHFLANVTNEQGDPVAARAFYEESQAHWRKLGNTLGVAYSLMMMAQAVAPLDGRAAAYPLLEESLALFRKADNKRGAAWALCTWAMQRTGDSRERTLCRSKRTLCRSLKDDPELRALIEESLILFREVGEKRGMTLNIAMLGSIALAQADPATARAFFQENLSLYRELGYQSNIAETLITLAEIAITQEQTQRAARLLGAAKSLCDAIGSSPSADHDRLASAARAALGDYAFHVAYAEGHALSQEQAIAYALSTSL
jgi:predicted ATPase/DNA-binding SARP family transcriptional activator